MDISELLAVLIGGGSVGAIIAAYMTRQTEKDQNKMDLLDRTYKEIERLEAKLREAEAEMEEKEEENYELRRVIFELKEQLSTLRMELQQLKGG